MNVESYIFTEEMISFHCHSFTLNIQLNTSEGILLTGMCCQSYKL